MMRALMIALAFLMILVGTAEAFAQCMPRDQFAANLKKIWGEDPVYWGVVPNGAIVELFLSSNDRRSFTIAITRPSGITCAIVGGYEWEKSVPPPVGEPA